MSDSDTPADAARLRKRVAELEARINTPLTDDWFDGVRLEVAHQQERWGASHDAVKAPLDWFWLIGYLAQKAATSHMGGDVAKAQHPTISTAAALLNWHKAIAGEMQAMGVRPEVEDTTNKPPIPAPDYALQWARDTLSGKEGGRFLWRERNLARRYLNMVRASATRAETDRAAGEGGV